MGLLLWRLLYWYGGQDKRLLLSKDRGLILFFKCGEVFVAALLVEILENWSGNLGAISLDNFLMSVQFLADVVPVSKGSKRVVQFRCFLLRLLSVGAMNVI